MAAVLACVVRSAAQTHVWMSGSVLSSAIVDASEADARASEPSNEPLTNFADRERKLSRPKQIAELSRSSMTYLRSDRVISRVGVAQRRRVGLVDALHRQMVHKRNFSAHMRKPYKKAPAVHSSDHST